MPYEIRPISSKEFGEFSESTATAFGIDQDAEYSSMKKSFFDFDRTIAIIDKNRICGACSRVRHIPTT